MLADVDAIAREAVLEAEAAVATGQVVVERGERVQYLPARPLLVATTGLDVRSAHGSLRVGLHGRGLYDLVLTPSVPGGAGRVDDDDGGRRALVRAARTVSAPAAATTPQRMGVRDQRENAGQRFGAQDALTSAVAAGHVHRRDEERVARRPDDRRSRQPPGGHT